MKTLILSTRNKHKVGEIQKILGDTFRYLTLDDFEGAPEVVEDGTTFEQNAIKKACELAEWITGNPERLTKAVASSEASYVVADDSGLEVDTLDGAPGVYSARFASDETGETGNSADAANNAKLLQMVEGISEQERSARFRCVIAIAELGFDKGSPPKNIQTFEGTCEGQIALTLDGASGFGYDPLFIPDGYKASFAELGETVKNKISHRSRALEFLRTSL